MVEDRFGDYSRRCDSIFLDSAWAEHPESTIPWDYVMRKSSRQQRFRLPEITAAMTVTNPYAAAIDVGARFHAAAIPTHLGAPSSRLFGCTTPDLWEMAGWMHSYGITTVALESTGNYWVQPLRVLEQAGFEVILVHPEYARQAKRTKYSDLDDSVWLQQMHAYGLLPASFQPPAPFMRLRTLWRHRDRLIVVQGSCLQKIQNALELMNVQLHKALSDISGLTGMSIIRAIVAGERDPAKLADYRDPRVHCSREDLIKALTGEYREAELFVLTQILAQYDFLHQQLTELDERIDAQLQELLPPPAPAAGPEHVAPLVPTATDPSHGDPKPAFRTRGGKDVPPAIPSVPSPTEETAVSSALPAPPPRHAAARIKPTVAPATATRKPPSKNEPVAYNWHAYLVQLLGVDATRICGLSVLLVLALISELGTDMSAWESAKRFTAWLGLAPDHRVSGGKVLKRRTRRGKPHAAHLFYVAALSVAKSQTPLGEFYRYEKARIGPGKALTATARKIAILYFNLLTYGPDFVEQGQQKLQDNSELRKLRKLRRMAKEFGFELVKPPQAA